MRKSNIRAGNCMDYHRSYIGYVFIDLAAKLAGLWCTIYLKYSEYKIATFNMNDILKIKIKYCQPLLPN